MTHPASSAIIREAEETCRRFGWDPHTIRAAIATVYYWRSFIPTDGPRTLHHAIMTIALNQVAAIAQQQQAEQALGDPATPQEPTLEIIPLPTTG